MKILLTVIAEGAAFPISDKLASNSGPLPLGRDLADVRFPPIADISELEETVPMAPLQRLFRFIDWDLGRPGYIRAGAWSLFIGLLIVSIPLAVFSFPYDGVAAWAIAVAIGLCLIWFGFVAWRALRLIRASAIKGDRSYDRQNKYKLAVDYHSTESETSASRRKGGDQL